MLTSNPKATLRDVQQGVVTLTMFSLTFPDLEEEATDSASNLTQVSVALLEAGFAS